MKINKYLLLSLNLLIIILLFYLAHLSFWEHKLNVTVHLRRFFTTTFFINLILVYIVFFNQYLNLKRNIRNTKDITLKDIQQQLSNLSKITYSVLIPSSLGILAITAAALCTLIKLLKEG